ncbi:unnamed protein product [Spirodela intermedia]|uniref:Cystatin domain-containing protein n=1 Tax=Spirodela intermedia TaxID=51605 RepID=A0A7I8JDV5_SPIIN|nr:unnamed protein product [Spirodela intermedia]CAA6668191.1 unnamed protein product [Spirodela intermedia]
MAHGGAVVPVIVLLTLCTASALSSGRTEIWNVKENKEVQELGRYAVRERNRRAGGDELVFLCVVRAQSQVVSGFKYFLRIATTASGGQAVRRRSRCFDAVVLVKPWLGSRELLHFLPATSSLSRRR